MTRCNLRPLEERLARIERLKRLLEDRNGTAYQMGALKGLEFALRAESVDMAVALRNLKTRIGLADLKADKQTYDPEMSGFLSALCWALGGEIPEFHQRT